MSRPNLFHYGRSELSQDAFLCWLLAWADAAQARDPSGLHTLGCSFVEALFASAEPKPALPPGPWAVEVLKQFGDCDIVALVGTQHVLLIEDKTDATHHNPLAAYRARVAKEYPGREQVCIYLKTGDQHSYQHIADEGWHVFGRRQLLDVLRQGRGSVHSDIFCDYLDHLEIIEAETNSFRTAPVSVWPWRAWSGFYLALQDTLPGAWWGYVANPSGGFMCFCWAFRDLDGGNQLYPQIEQGKLVVKLRVPDPDRRSRDRDRWVAKMVGEHDGLELVRPSRLGHGQWMTVAQLEGDYRLTDTAGALDLGRTTSLLQRFAGMIANVEIPG